MGSTLSIICTRPVWCSTGPILFFELHRARPGLGSRRGLRGLRPRAGGAVAEGLGTLHPRRSGGDGVAGALGRGAEAFSGTDGELRRVFPVRRNRPGERRYVAPDLLPGFEAVPAGRSRTRGREEAGGPALRLRYRFFHPGGRTAPDESEVGGRAGDRRRTHWKYGLWLRGRPAEGQPACWCGSRTRAPTSRRAPGCTVLPGRWAGRARPAGGDPRRAILEQRIGEAPEERS